MDNNSYATLELAERMLEAYERGWQATADDVNKLKMMVLDIEAWIE